MKTTHFHTSFTINFKHLHVQELYGYETTITVQSSKYYKQDLNTGNDKFKESQMTILLHQYT